MFTPTTHESRNDMTTYIVSISNQVNIEGIYGTRSVAGTYSNENEANAQAAYIASFCDSAVAIEKMIA